jgi:prefoldin subunit 5
MSDEKDIRIGVDFGDKKTEFIMIEYLGNGQFRALEDTDAVKKLHTRIKELEKENADLKEQITDLNLRLDEVSC